VTGQDQLQRRVRRNAIVLALVAVAFYVGYFLIQISHSAP
jgi:hypothetical protein